MLTHRLLYSVMLISTMLSAPTLSASTVPEKEVCLGLVCIEVVEVANPGNAADVQTGLGAVSEQFSIGKYEITVKQYLRFLNAVATRPYLLPDHKQEAIVELWHPDMQHTHDYVSKQGLIERTGMGTEAQPYLFSEIPDPYWGVRSQDRSIINITWFSAARFVNWLHHGATPDADTESGAYTLNGARTGNFSRSADARWWLPSQNEWYKAAYFDPTRTGSQPYWNYPTRNDVLPQAVPPPGGPNSANYNSGQTVAHRITPVGAYSNSKSYYGTFDQAGLLWEWSDTSFADHDGRPTTMNLLGGSWSLGQINISKYGARDYLPQYQDDDTGFRVATKGSPR